MRPTVCILVTVVLGGGRRHWIPRVSRDPEDDQEGRRVDGRNLVDDWIRDKERRGLKAEYVWNRRQLEALNLTQVDRLLGLFSYSHMDFEADRSRGPDGDPSLVDMTKAALTVLKKNTRGFFLFIESGRIDHAHHYNNPYRALDETLVLEETLLEVLRVTDPQETLIVMTSDHSHVLTFGGLSTPVGNPILGLDSTSSDVDGMPYSTLLYGNGPGYSSTRYVPNNLSSPNTVHSAAVPRHWATHGGEDVPVFAQGPLATTLFSGTMEQSVIPHAIAYIGCLGEYSKRCRGRDDFPLSDLPSECNNSAEVHPSNSKRREGVMLASSVLNQANPNTVSQSVMCLLLVFQSVLNILSS